MSVNVNPDPTNLDKARRAWGADMPEWIAVLARACDATNQREVGDRLERSSGYVSRVINRLYAGSYEEAEQRVRSRLGAAVVSCPVWNDCIPLTACIRNRRRKGGPQSQIHHTYARTCPRCPNNTDTEENRP